MLREHLSDWDHHPRTQISGKTKPAGDDWPARNGLPFQQLPYLPRRLLPTLLVQLLLPGRHPALILHWDHQWSTCQVDDGRHSLPISSNQSLCHRAFDTPKIRQLACSSSSMPLRSSVALSTSLWASWCCCCKRSARSLTQARNIASRNRMGHKWDVHLQSPSWEMLKFGIYTDILWILLIFTHRRRTISGWFYLQTSGPALASREFEALPAAEHTFAGPLEASWRVAPRDVSTTRPISKSPLGIQLGF